MSSGFDQVLQWRVGDTGDFTAFDRHTGEATPDGGEWEHALGAGGTVVEWLNMIEPAGSADTSLQAGSLIPYIYPASIGELPDALTIQAGLAGDATGGVQYGDAYLTAVELSLEENGVVAVNYEWKALSLTSATITAATPSNAEPFPWHGATCTIGGQSYHVGSWTVRLEHDISLHTDLDAKAAGSARLPVWAEPGPWTTSVTATVRVPMGLAHLGDSGAVLDMELTTTSYGTPASTLTITGSDLRVDGVSNRIVEGGELVEYELTMHGRPNDLSAVTVAIA